MIERTIHADGTVSTIDRRRADKWGERLKIESSKRCGREITAYATAEDQLNAYGGATIDGDHTGAEVAAFVAARRGEHAARKAAIQAILDDAQLDNAGKLAAFDAL